jgi:hypothetical protein
LGPLARALAVEMRYTFQGESLTAGWIGSHQTMMWNLYQVGSWSHDAGHHCDVVWELCDRRAPTSGCAFGKARAPNIHYKPCTTVDECHPRCWELQRQHHGVVLAFVRWAAGLTCLRTLLFARCRQDLVWGWIVLFRMLPFEMAPEVITAVKCALATINEVRISAVDGSTDNNSTSGSMNHTG